MGSDELRISSFTLMSVELLIQIFNSGVSAVGRGLPESQTCTSCVRAVN